jgi:hypothetical protein
MTNKVQRRKVTVRLYGGLGNQIFQYIFGKFLEEDYSLDVTFDASWLDSKTNHFESDIRNFKFSENLKLERKKSALRVKWESAITSLALRSDSFARITNIHFENTLSELGIIPIKNNAKFRGYYQNISFPERIMDEIANLNWEPIPKKRDAHEGLLSLAEQKFIAVHVRGGDYLSPNSIYAILPTAYYRDSLAQLNEEMPNPHVIVFTDDKVHAAGVLPKDREYSFASDFQLSTTQEFFLMSKAQAHVIANSTFSYWAARISQTSIVTFSPKEWYRQQNERKPIYPGNWRIN